MTDLSSLSDDDLKSAYASANAAASQGNAPATPAAPAVQSTLQKATATPSDFAATYGPAAQRAGAALSVHPNVLLGQWGLETGWGKSVIPGTNNLGNIKDFTGGGVPATDNALGTRDNYRAFASPDEFADHYVGLINRKYPSAVGAGSDASKFAGALAAGGYAQDPNYATKVAAAANTVSKATNPVLNAANTVTSALMPSANAATPQSAPADLSKLSDEELMAHYNALSSQQAPAAQSSPNTGPNPFQGPAQASAQPAQQKAIGWSDVPLEAAKNFIPSAINVGKGIVQAVAHPIDTVTNLADLAAGGLRNALPSSVSRLVDSIDTNPQATARATQVADNVGAFYKDRYGSMDGVKNALATDPAGVLSDVAGVASGGAGAVAKGAGLAGTVSRLGGAAKLASVADRVGQIANTVGDVANVANPVNLGAQAIKKGILAPADIIGSNALGMTTGVGAGTIRDAAKAGAAGDASFLDNLSGKANIQDVLDAARQNVQEMGRQKSAAYRSGMTDISKDQTVLHFNDIDQAIQQADAMSKYKGQVKNPQAAQAVSKIADEVNNWKTLNPADFHTPEGLDALKQRIGGILEDLPFEQKTARSAAGGIYSAVKNTIADQAPTYAKVMKDYADASDQIKEVERAFSLGQNASADTALRKLQSLTRNNANTNYGFRQQLADTMQQQGGQSITPALAGQAMSSWTPRGLMAAAQVAAHAGAGLATGGTSLLGSLATLPLGSPKLIGYGLYGAGRGAGIAQGLASRLPVSSAGLNAASQAGNLQDRRGINRLAGVPAFADGGLVGDDDQTPGMQSMPNLAQMTQASAQGIAAQDAGNSERRVNAFLTDFGESQQQQYRVEQHQVAIDQSNAIGSGLDARDAAMASGMHSIAQGRDAEAAFQEGNKKALDAIGFDPTAEGYANGGLIGQDALAGDTFEDRIAAAYAAHRTPTDDLGNGRRQIINPDGTAGDTVYAPSQAALPTIAQSADFGGYAGSTVQGLMAGSAFAGNSGGPFNGRILRSFKNGGMVGASAMESPVRALAFGRGRRS